ncbi:MAG: SAM-dependent methyltransferase [Spirillospora sp.]
MRTFDGRGYLSDVDSGPGRRTTTIFQSWWPGLWNHWSGGKDNYLADRLLGGIVAERYPEIERIAELRLEARARLVRYMVAAASVRQLAVVGCDLPVRDEVHDVAHQRDPRVRVLYVTDHPVVMVHARGLLDGAGTAGYVEAAVTDPARVLAGAAPILDLDEPVGVLFLNTFDVLGTATGRRITRAFADALAPGSHIALTHLSAQGRSLPNGRTSAERELRDLFTLWQTPPPILRDRAEVAHLLNGWSLLEPGVTSVPQWRPGSLPHQLDPSMPGRIRLVVAAARKPGVPSRLRR